jgi:hypothetical protein
MAIATVQLTSSGPLGILSTLAAEESHRTMVDLDVKLLADTCWTRANTLEGKDPKEALAWAKAAFAGYKFLERHGSPEVSESARENADLLKDWASESYPDHI